MGNFGSRRLAIKESHGYKLSNISRKVRIFRKFFDFLILRF